MSERAYYWTHDDCRDFFGLDTTNEQRARHVKQGGGAPIVIRTYGDEFTVAVDGSFTRKKWFPSDLKRKNGENQKWVMDCVT